MPRLQGADESKLQTEPGVFYRVFPQAAGVFTVLRYHREVAGTRMVVTCRDGGLGLGGREAEANGTLPAGSRCGVWPCCRWCSPGCCPIAFVDRLCWDIRQCSPPLVSCHPILKDHTLAGPIFSKIHF